MCRAAICLVLLAAACSEDIPDPRAKEASELRDIAMVEAAQKVGPPREPVTPADILPSDRDDNSLFGVSCGFVPAGQEHPVALGMASAAYVKLGEQMQRFAADKGAASMPFGTWAKYDGKKYSLRFEKIGDVGKLLTSESSEWPGRMTVSDPYDRVVYRSSGSFRCGS